MTDQELIDRLADRIRSFKIEVAGGGELRGGFGEIPDHGVTLKHLQKAFSEFGLTGNQGIQAHGSIEHGYALFGNSAESAGGGSPSSVIPNSLSEIEKLLNNFRIVGQDGISAYGSLSTGYAVQTQVTSGFVAGSSGFPGGIIPPTGACCNGTDCSIQNQSNCQTSGGTYQGDGTHCDPNPCTGTTIGACCFDDGGCFTESSSGCLVAGGHYQGDATVCGDIDCSHGGPGTRGACCIGTFCFSESPQDCFNDGGTYQGDDSACSPNPCVTLTGACCTPDMLTSGGCSNNVTSDQCSGFGGLYYGNGTDCTTLPDRGCCEINTGGCNFSLFSGATESCCTLNGGFFQGVGLCGDFVIACCFSDGFSWFCESKTPHECDCVGGTPGCSPCPP